MARIEEQPLVLDVWNNLTRPDREVWLRENLGRIEPFPWKPQEILPARLEKNRPLIVEIMGLAEAGKTSGHEALLATIEEEPVRVVDIPEFGGRSNTRRAARTVDFDFESNLLEPLKMVAFSEGMIRVINYLLGDIQNEQAGNPILMICERGPNDALAHFAWIAEYIQGKKRVPSGLRRAALEGQIGFDYREYVAPRVEEDWLRNFFQELSLASWVDAVVLYGCSLETAMKRRGARGLPAEGRLTNPRIRPQLERAFGWWLGSVYPLLQKNRGTGLLVVDGERSFKQNNAQLINYCQEILARQRQAV